MCGLTRLRIRREGQDPARRRSCISRGHSLSDLSSELASVGDRDKAFPLPHGRGDNFHHGSPTPDPRNLPPKRFRPRDIYIRDLHIDTIKVKGGIQAIHMRFRAS
jgi:error-prone DNA polymerase